MRYALIVAVLLLAGCTGRTVVEERPVTVLKPVPQPCAASRPVAVVPLRQRYSDAEWAALDPKQKAAIVSRQMLDYRAYGESLNAATAACP